MVTDDLKRLIRIEPSSTVRKVYSEAIAEIEHLQALLMEAAIQLRQSEHPSDWEVAARCEKARRSGEVGEST